MRIENTDEYTMGYNIGYDKGYNDAWSKVVEHFRAQLINSPSPKIIVTTQENIERLKKEYNV